MTSKVESKALTMIFEGAWDRVKNTPAPGNPFSPLEAVISECWGILTPAQRDKLMASSVVGDLCALRTPDPAEVVTLPHNHHVVTYSTYDEEEAAFQRLMGVWYQIADILRQKPAGTVAAYPGGSLIMAEMDGELFMFDSPDLSRDSIGWTTFRPDDFNGIGASDLNDIHDFLIAWTETPTFGTPVHPELVSGTIEQNYDKASSRPYWKWNGITTA